MNQRHLLSVLGLVLILVSTQWACKKESPQAPTAPTTVKEPTLKIPVFEADSAYDYIAQQVAFGPRVLGSEGHKATRQWLASELRKTADKVIEQEFTANVYSGESFRAANIIAQFNPEVSDRILLAAHWDTRHVADSPLNEERTKEPILGADDGGSGVGVLLEIARQLKDNPVGLGVDIILFDAEDYGKSDPTENTSETYCLGSQYWGRNPHSPYRARYGILLDMVGAKGAKFLREGYSYQQINPDLVNKIWTLANRMGKSNYFIKRDGPGITDDHFFVYKYGRVPMIDIINLAGTEQTAFGPHWHTHNDDMSIIDKNTLRAVGQVLLAAIYREDTGVF